MINRVMVNGIPGNMGRIVAESAQNRGLEVIPFSLTGEDVPLDTVEVNNKAFTLLKPSSRDTAITDILHRYPGLIAIDYTHPTAVNPNAEFYVRHRIPFVMGTTGGDRDALAALVAKASLHCVIAPNMSKQIVAFQAIVEQLATQFPTAFSGYRLSIVESHQKTKADTSGTAKAVAGSFRKMGFSFQDSQIEMVRDEATQLAMGVPSEWLGGHAFHTYGIDSPDGTVHFEFKHDICGRKVYAEGSIDAVEYLAKCILRGDAPRCHSMMDVLRAGAMR